MTWSPCHWTLSVLRAVEPDEQWMAAVDERGALIVAKFFPRFAMHFGQVWVAV